VILPFPLIPVWMIFFNLYKQIFADKVHVIFKKHFFSVFIFSNCVLIDAFLDMLPYDFGMTRSVMKARALEFSMFLFAILTCSIWIHVFVLDVWVVGADIEAVVDGELFEDVLKSLDRHGEAIAVLECLYIVVWSLDTNIEYFSAQQYGLSLF